MMFAALPGRRCLWDKWYLYINASVMFGLFGKLKDFLIPTLRNQQHKTSSFASGEWRPNKKRRAASREDVTGHDIFGRVGLVRSEKIKWHHPPALSGLFFWSFTEKQIGLSWFSWAAMYERWKTVSPVIHGGIVFCMVLCIDVGILRYSGRVFCTLFLLGVSHEIAMNADVFLALPKSRWTKRGARAIRVDWGCQFWWV